MSEAPDAPFFLARSLGGAVEAPEQGAASAKVYDGPDLTLVVLALAPGAALGEHTSRRPVSLYVLEGAGARLRRRGRGGTAAGNVAARRARRSPRGQGDLGDETRAYAGKGAGVSAARLGGLAKRISSAQSAHATASMAMPIA